MQMVWKMLLLPGPLWPLELRIWHHKVPKPHLSNFTCQELLLVSEPGKTVKHLDVPQDQRFSPSFGESSLLNSPWLSYFSQLYTFFLANQNQQLQKPAVEATGCWRTWAMMTPKTSRRTSAGIWSCCRGSPMPWWSFTVSARCPCWWSMMSMVIPAKWKI